MGIWFLWSSNFAQTRSTIIMMMILIDFLCFHFEILVWNFRMACSNLFCSFIMVCSFLWLCFLIALFRSEMSLYRWLNALLGFFMFFDWFLWYWCFTWFVHFIVLLVRISLCLVDYCKSLLVRDCTLVDLVLLATDLSCSYLIHMRMPVAFWGLFLLIVHPVALETVYASRWCTLIFLCLVWYGSFHCCTYIYVLVGEMAYLVDYMSVHWAAIVWIWTGLFVW